MRSAARTSPARSGVPARTSSASWTKRALGFLHLLLVALQHDVVAAGNDADVQLRLEGAEMIVVAPEEREQVDILRQ